MYIYTYTHTYVTYACNHARFAHSRICTTARKTLAMINDQVSVADMELDSDKIAQGGLGILYKGFWRGCPVAVKKPVDPRSASDPALKADFQREVREHRMRACLYVCVYAQVHIVLEQTHAHTLCTHL